MTKLKWDKGGEYEVGVDRGVYFPIVGPGLPWNGLSSVDEDVDDAEDEFRYIDGVKIRTKRRSGGFRGSIESHTYPIELDSRKPFGLSYRTKTANAYKIHLVYNTMLAPTSATWNQKEATKFQWNFTTLPTDIPGYAPSAHLVVDTGVAYSWTTAAFEDVLYGSDSADPRLPAPLEVLDIFEENSILQIIDHGDGTWTAKGPDSVITMLDPTTFKIDWPSAVFIDAVTYKIRSL